MQLTFSSKYSMYPPHLFFMTSICFVAETQALWQMSVGIVLITSLIAPPRLNIVQFHYFVDANSVKVHFVK